MESSSHTIRHVLHYLLVIPGFLGLALLLYFITQSARGTVGERPVSKLASESWAEAVKRVPADMPVVWPDDEGELPESLEDLNADTRERWGKTNAFIISCSLLVLLGGVGIGLMTAALTEAEPPGFPLLRFGAAIFLILPAWLFWGFNLAYPGEHTGIFPKLYFGFPSMGPVDYGMGGMTAWTDCFFIAVYSLLGAGLFLSFSAARVRATALMLIAIPFATISFPFLISWKWGGGWIDMLNNTYDFAGSALLHWHTGAAALVAGGLLTLFKRKVVLPEPGKVSPLVFPFMVIGGLLYIVGLIGLNAGSTLDSAPDAVAVVLQVSTAGALVSAILSVVWWFFFRNRGLIEMVLIGLAGGVVVVSGATDSLTWNGVFILASLAGLAVPGFVVVMDRIGWVDPLAVGPVHGVAGLIGTIGASCASFSDGMEVSLVGQMILAAVVPVGAIFLTAAVILLAGAAGYVFRGAKRSHSGEVSSEGASPPMLPKA